MAQTQKPRAAATRKKTSAAQSAERQRMIAEAAYFKAEKRGFAPGKEKDDWIKAETEIEANLSEQ